MIMWGRNAWTMGIVVLLLVCPVFVAHCQLSKKESLKERLLSELKRERELGYKKICEDGFRYPVGNSMDYVKKEQNQLLRISGVPAGLALLGAYSWSNRESIKKLRDRYYPKFRYNLDDYLQYAPAVAVYGLNLVGVKGKHDVLYASKAFAIACLLNSTIVNTMKQSINVARPDGSNNNSFPSGHTATAFMTATFLHKEYGQHKPFYSFLGYSAASAVGIMRMLNNVHWMPDVLVGAGIGILSTQLAYAVADKIFTPRRRMEPEANPFRIINNERQVFFIVKTGVANPVSRLLTGSDGLQASPGFVSSIEGGYYFKKWLGLGVQLNVSSFNVNSDKLYLDSSISHNIASVNTQAFGSSYFLIGPYFNWSLPRRWSLTMNVNGGVSLGAPGAITATLKRDNGSGMTQELSRFTPSDAFAWGVGLNIRKRINKSIALGAYANYFNNRPYMQVDSFKDGRWETDIHKMNLSLISFGVSVTAFL
ncbi:phosphatase PAP2 family protein [Prolixibacteraceae bacterium JC049]|nr:phosphatase PAP2 family protein [Prolixibacteraceae bacterium JC049]